MFAQRLTYPALVALLLLAGMQPARALDGAPVSVTTVQEQAIQRPLALTGTVTAARAAQLSTSTSGLVSMLNVDAGSVVRSGQLLLQLDPELAQLQLRSATAQVEQARNALADARRRLEEARSLAPQQSIAESAVRDLAAEVSNDEAALRQATADAAYREGVLDRHALRAPFDGVVSAKLTELGEWVNPGQAVLELVTIDDVRLDFPVPEDYLADMQPGAAVSFSLNANPGQEYSGRVATVVPVTEPGARTFLLRVLADDKGQRMIPGMSVRAQLRLATGTRGLAVPRDAILRFPDGRVVVWTVEPGPEGELIVRENRVTTGYAYDAMVEIREGLQAGARIVIRGNEALQDGQQVVVRPVAGGS